MSMKTALDGINNILAILVKGEADAATKLDAVRPLCYDLKNDLEDLAAIQYANYIPPEPEWRPGDDTLETAVAKLYVPLSKQMFNLLTNFYDSKFFEEEDDPFIRLAHAKALLQIAAEQEKTPPQYWIFVAENNGNILEEDDE